MSDNSQSIAQSFMHFVQPFDLLRMRFPMAFLAQRYQVCRIIRTFRAIFKVFNVVDFHSFDQSPVSFAILTGVMIPPQYLLPVLLPLLRFIKTIVVMFILHVHTSKTKRHTPKNAPLRQGRTPTADSLRLYCYTTTKRPLITDSSYFFSRTHLMILKSSIIFSAGTCEILTPFPIAKLIYASRSLFAF